MALDVPPAGELGPSEDLSLKSFLTQKYGQAFKAAVREFNASMDLQLPALRAELTSSGPLATEITLAFGRNRLDTNLRSQKLRLSDLVASFAQPDLDRGKLTSREYHALSKEDPGQKAQKSAEKDGRCFSVALFNEKGGRREENVIGVVGMVLDFDSGRTTEEIIRERLKGLTYIAYTSYSHLPGNERWRVLIPYSAVASINTHKTAFKHFQRLFDSDLDPRCGVASQIWYTPACPRDASGEFRAFHQIGEWLDPGNLPIEEVRKVVEPRPALQVPAPTIDTERLKSALAHIDSDDRQNWIEVGLAIRNDLGDAGFELWKVWSARSPKFDEGEAIKTWESFKSRAPGEPVVTLGSVYYLAKSTGWTDVPDYIAKMNLEYFVAPLGRHVEIFREHVDPRFGYRTVTPMDKDDFQLKYENKFVTVVGSDGQPRRLNLATAWRKHEGRREYEGVVLAPNRKVAGCYNRWNGFAVAAIQDRGKWRRMRWHILYVICAGDRRLYRYVLGWLAFAVQNPGERAQVALVLQGGRGTGKGMFVSALGRLFGIHFRHITHAKHLTGHFNAHLADCLLLFADEAFWAGDKQGESALKGVITESTITIERKGLDAESVPNMLKIIMASNSDWVVPAGMDERRFCVLAVSNIRQQDGGYFRLLKEEIDNGGLNAMLHDLLNRDISRFEITAVPNTDALKDQKLRTLDPARGWWLDRLTAGQWSQPLSHNSAFAITFPWAQVPKHVVHDDYIRALQKTGVSRRGTQTELGIALRTLLPPGWPRSSKVTGLGGRVDHYEFPPLADCRAHFEKLAAMEGYKWPDEGGDVKPV